MLTLKVSSADFIGGDEQRQVLATPAQRADVTRAAARSRHDRGGGQARRGTADVTRLVRQARSHADHLLRAAGDTLFTKVVQLKVERFVYSFPGLVDESSVRDEPRQSVAVGRRAVGRADAGQLCDRFASEQSAGATRSAPLLLHCAVHAVHAVPRQRHLPVSRNIKKKFKLS